MQQALIDRIIGEWRHCLENIVQCNGKHIDHVCYRGLTTNDTRDFNLSRTCLAFSFAK